MIVDGTVAPQSIKVRRRGGGWEVDRERIENTEIRMMSDGGDMTEKSTALIVTELEFDEREREELVLLGLVWLVRVVEVVVVEWVLNGSLGRHPLQERNRNREEGEELR